MSEALWALGRGTGVVALVMFTATLVLGIVSRSGRPVAGLGRFGINELHRTAALTGVGLIAVHLTSLFFDPYAQLKVVDLLVPFVGTYRPVLPRASGTLAVDLLAGDHRGQPAAQHRRTARVPAPCTGSPTRCGRSPWCTAWAPAPTPASLWMDAVAVTCARPPSLPRSPGACSRRTPSAAAPESPGWWPDDRAC